MHRCPVGDAADLDAGREDIGRATERDHRHVAAIRHAGDADAPSIHITGVDQELDACDIVFEIAAPEVADVGAHEVAAVARRAARVRRDHEVAAGSERNGRRVVAVLGLAGRSTMRDHDRGGTAVARGVGRRPEDRADERAVLRGIGHDLRRRELGDLGLRHAQDRGVTAALRVVAPVGERLGTGLMREDDPTVRRLGGQLAEIVGVHSRREPQRLGACRGDVVALHDAATVDVIEEQQRLTVGGEPQAALLPRSRREHPQFLRADVEQRRLFAAIRGLGRERQPALVGTDVRHRVDGRRRLADHRLRPAIRDAYTVQRVLDAAGDVRASGIDGTPVRRERHRGPLPIR